MFYWWNSSVNLKKVILYKLIDNSSSNIKNIFTNTIWNKYRMAFKLLDDDIDKILDSRNFEHFSFETRNFFQNANLLQVLIYTKYDDLLFVLHRDYEYERNHHLNLDGSGFIYEDEMGDIISVIPIYSKVDYIKDMLPDIIMELKYDSSPLIKYIDNMYLSYFVSIALLVIVAFSIIYYILLVNRNALKKQYAVNVKLKIAKDSAEEDNVKKSMFLANISHELKTPLNSIIGFSQLMKGDNDGDKSQNHEYISEIYNAGVHLLSLINDILDFSKTEVNKLTIQNNIFDVNRVLHSSIKMVQPRAEKYRLDIKVNIPEEPIIVKADARRVKQVFLNILSNALKFTKEGGRITVISEQGVDVVSIIIEDTGIGIADKDLAKAMSTFGQTDSDLSRKYEGTGLGLPLSKNLIELMGGEFQIDSKKEHGTKVVIAFPKIK